MLLAVVAGTESSYAETKRVVNMHINPGGPGKKTSLFLFSRRHLSLHQLREAMNGLA